MRLVYQSRDTAQELTTIVQVQVIAEEFGDYLLFLQDTQAFISH